MPNLSPTANDTNVRMLRAEFLVNDQSSLLIGLNSNVFQSETGGVWASTNGNQNNVGIQSLLLATL